MTVASEVGPLLAEATETTRRLAAKLSGPEGSALPAVAAARELTRLVDQLVRIAVERTRASGHTWQEIGAVLGTTRQAAFQRFGRPVDPRTGVPMAQAILPGAVDRAVQLMADLVDGRYRQIGGDFTETMSQRLTADRLAAAWAQLVGTVGGYERMGEAQAYQAGDFTVVDVALSFEAGDVTGRVSYDKDGKVAGLYLLRADRPPLPAVGPA